MDFIHAEVDAGPANDVVVTLRGSAANVMLLDSGAFQSFRSRRRFRYYGGYFRASPAVVRPPHYGRWHVVVQPVSGPVSASIEVR